MVMHKNILPLEGYLMEGAYPSLISEWMENETASDYVKQHPSIDRTKLVGSTSSSIYATTDTFGEILGIAEGLHYLHSHDIVHSDLKAASRPASPGRTTLTLYNSLGKCPYILYRRASHK